MSRYIDVDEEIRKINEAISINEQGRKEESLASYCLRRVAEALEKAPTADVEEVKNGYWKMCYYPNDEHVECSECHTQYYENDLYLGGNEFPKRCPECGAHMRKEKEE